MRDDLDGDLLQLFEEKNPELPEEPFRAGLRRRIEKARTARNRAYWLSIALVLAACAALANFIIDGVTLLCGELTSVLQIAGEFLTTPAGLTVVAAAALLSLVFQRRVLCRIM
jgi:hypothetical protein